MSAFAGGGAAAVDRVSILQGVICSTECVAGAEEVGVCRGQRRRPACVAEEEGGCGRVTSRGCSGGRGDVDEELAGAAVKIVFTMSCLGGVC